MNVVTKSVDAAITPVESENPNGEFEVVLSTESLDRDGERLYIDEWKQPLPKRIQIDGDHSRSIEKTVGSVVPRIEGNKLIGKGSYAPTAYAQDIRKIASDKSAEGHALSLSVTFAEYKNEKSGKPQRELLNAGFVAIPANSECVILSSKSATIEDKADGGLSASGDNPEAPKHDDMVQAIHDAACHLGAQCLNDIEAQSGAADGANKGIASMYIDVIPRLKALEIEKSSTPEGGSPQKSPDDSPAEAATEAAADAPADVPAKAADDSADNTAALKAKEAEKARALAFLIRQNAKES